MKQFLLLYFIGTFTFFSVGAQKNEQKFGTIDKADLEMKDCDFDKGADALKLIDWQSTQYQRGRVLFSTISQIRVRLKIFKEKGLTYADVKIPYYSKGDIERIEDIEGFTYNLDAGGNIVTTKLDKSFVYRKKTDKRNSVVSFAFPNTHEGSVIEYRYTLIRESFSYINDWYFQDKIPTRFSCYNLQIPSLFKFLINPLVSMKVDISESTKEESISVDEKFYNFKVLNKTYVLRDVPAVRKEPYMSSFEDYLQRLSFELSRIEFENDRNISLVKTLPKFAEELMDDEDFGKELRKNIIEDPNLDRQVAAAATDAQKITIVYNFVRNQMTEIENNSIYTKFGVKEAWDKRNGNASDINFLLINALRTYHLDAYPLLSSTRDNGLVNTTYPFVSQFNRVLAYVKDGNNYFVLNAADKYNPARLIPYDVNNSECLLLDGAKTRWLIISKPEHQIRNEVFISADIDDKGMLTGEATIKSFDYEKNPRCKKWKEDREEFIKNGFAPYLSGMKTDSVEVLNADIDSLPLLQNLKFTALLNKTGEYCYFNTNLFSSLSKNPFIADTRQTDIEFGNKQFYEINGIFSLPDGYQLDELPKKITLITPDTGIVFMRSAKLEEGMIAIHITLEYRNTFYPVDQYPEFREFSKKMYNLLNEQIVLKKK